MAELLVRVVDKVNKDFYLNTKCTKRGDVIVIQPDGWNWGREELTNPEWQIIRIPGIAPDDLDVYIAPEIETNPANPSKTLQRRGFKFDIDALSQHLANGAVTGTIHSRGARKDVTAVLNIPAALSYHTAKPPIPDINSNKL